MSKPIEFVTYRKFGSYDVNSMTNREPSCWNGTVRIRQYRVTITEVPEARSVLVARVQELWDVCSNHHHWQALKAAAKELDYELVGRAGNSVERCGHGTG